jgi:hypothetical protein
MRRRRGRRSDGGEAISYMAGSQWLLLLALMLVRR